MYLCRYVCIIFLHCLCMYYVCVCMYACMHAYACIPNKYYDANKQPF